MVGREAALAYCPPPAQYGVLVNDWTAVIAGLGGTVLGAGIGLVSDRLATGDRRRERRAEAADKLMDAYIDYAGECLNAIREKREHSDDLAVMKLARLVGTVRQFRPPARFMRALLEAIRVTNLAASEYELSQINGAVIGELTVWASSGRLRSALRWRGRTSIF